MKFRLRPFPAFLIVLGIISIFYLRGVPGVPFHPDESTYLFTSIDAELFWKAPAELFWKPENTGSLLQQYRVLDAPLANDILALGRWIAGQPALPVDWDWGQTWQENAQRGALPTQGLLLAGRFAVASLFPFSVLFLYLAARRVSGELSAWIAALLLASNALVLLHTRRAMAEGPLLLATTFTLWSLIQADKRPWLTGIPAGLAFCAKQSLSALAPAGLLAAIWQPGGSTSRPTRSWLPRAAGRACLFLALLGAVIIILNPFLWQQPLPALQAAFQARKALIAAQTSDRPQQALNSPGLRLVGMVGGLYMTPPVFSETGNYLEQTRAAEDRYLASPLNRLFRSLPAGAMMLILTLYGFTRAILTVLRAGWRSQRGLVLLILATLLQALAILAFVTLPWQRYYLPLVPFSCLWVAYGLSDTLAAARPRMRLKALPAVD